MKHFLLILLSIMFSTIVYSQTNHIDKFEKDFERVSRAYQEALMPEIKKFAEIQYEFKGDSITYNMLVLSRSEFYRATMENLTKQSFELFMEKLETDPEKKIEEKFLVDYFDSLYRNTFTGLTFAFYNDVKNKLGVIKED